MGQIPFQIVIILSLILLNGFFALAEIAVISSRRAVLEEKARSGNKRAETAMALADQPDKFLSTIQAGITLVGIFAGAFGGATLAEPLAAVIQPFVGEFAATIALVVVVGTITYLSVVIGELVPKQIGLKHANRIAMAVAGPMQTLAKLATPIVKLLTGSTNGIIRLLGISADSSMVVTEEEIRGLVRQGAKAGVIDEAEREMVEGVFRLGDYRLEAVLTPRPEVVWLDINAPAEKMRSIIESTDNSRFPVCDGDLDNVVGVVRAKSLLSPMLRGEQFDVREAMTKPIFMPESMPAIKALELFKESGTHLAMIVDEYGSVEGVVTLFDILEAIVGDIPTLDEIEDPRITERGDGSFLVDGIIPIHDFKEYFEIEALPNENDFQTLAGFVLDKIREIPAAGDAFDWEQFRFEIVDMDANRVDKVLVSRNDE